MDDLLKTFQHNLYTLQALAARLLARPTTLAVNAVLDEVIAVLRKR